MVLSNLKKPTTAIKFDYDYQDKTIEELKEIMEGDIYSLHEKGAAISFYGKKCGKDVYDLWWDFIINNKGGNITTDIAWLHDVKFPVDFLVSKIEDPKSKKERESAIIELEMQPLGDHKKKALNALWQYVMENKSSTNDNKLIIVCSAIRKLVFCIDDLQEIHLLYKNVFLWVELEISKTIHYRIEVHGYDGEKSPELVKALQHVVKKYLKKDTVEERGVGACLKNAIICLYYFDRESYNHYMDRLERMQVDWLWKVINKYTEGK